MPSLSSLQRTRPLLWMLAAVGLLVLNSVFLYYAFAHPDVLAEAAQNPISAVFQLEAFLLLALAAWLIHRLGLRRPGWLAFVVMSLAGTLAFSVPAFLLLHLRKRDDRRVT